MQPKLRNAIGTSTTRRNRQQSKQAISAAAFEALEKRQMFAVTASFIMASRSVMLLESWVSGKDFRW